MNIRLHSLCLLLACVQLLGCGSSDPPEQFTPAEQFTNFREAIDNDGRRCSWTIKYDVIPNNSALRPFRASVEIADPFTDPVVEYHRFYYYYQAGEWYLGYYTNPDSKDKLIKVYFVDTDSSKMLNLLEIMTWPGQTKRVKYHVGEPVHSRVQ
jgi:hypothetical protein